MALANAQMHWSARALIEQFEEALASRDAIGQAKGIIMARSGGDADDAFAVVRRASQRENKKLSTWPGDNDGDAITPNVLAGTRVGRRWTKHEVEGNTDE